VFVVNEGAELFPVNATCSFNIHLQQQQMENDDTPQEVGHKLGTAELLAESDNKILSFLFVIALLFANMYIYIPNYIYTVYNRNIECI